MDNEDSDWLAEILGVDAVTALWLAGPPADDETREQFESECG